MKIMKSLILSSGIIFAASGAHAASECMKDIDHFRAEATGAKIMDAQNGAEETVTVTSNGKEVEVPAIDAEPTESWFGMPPGHEAVVEYVNAARMAAEEGDEESCRENLENARVALEDAN